MKVRYGIIRGDEAGRQIMMQGDTHETELADGQAVRAMWLQVDDDCPLNIPLVHDGPSVKRA